MALLLTFWINLPLVAVIRITDLIILGATAIWLLRGQLRIGAPGFIILSFFAIYFVSMAGGIVYSENLEILRIVFLYKYAVPFILLAIFLRYKIFAHKLDMLIKFNVFIFLALAIFVYVHIVLHLYSPIPLPWRPSFPLTRLDANEATDSHVYSAYIANGLVFLILAQYFKLIRFPLAAMLGITVVCIVALILTGSRNGIFSFAVTMALFFILLFVTRGARGEPFIDPIHVLIGIIGIAAMLTAVLFLGDAIRLEETIDKLVSRITSIDLNDQSVLARLTKLTSAFVQVIEEGPAVIGIGMLASNATWYDSSIAALLMVGGVFGLVVFCLAIMIFLVNLSLVARSNQRGGEFLIVSMLVFNYVVANLITEFFLVTRSIVPFIINICLIINLIYTPRLKTTQ